MAVPIPPPQGKRQAGRVKDILLDAQTQTILASTEIRDYFNRHSGVFDADEIDWIDYEKAVGHSIIERSLRPRIPLHFYNTHRDRHQNRKA